MFVRKFMNYKEDKYNFKYYEWSSLRWTLAVSIWEFVEINPEYEEYYKPRVGQKYVIYSKLRNIYELHQITDQTRDTDIEELIEQKRVYLLND